MNNRQHKSKHRDRTNHADPCGIGKNEIGATMKQINDAYRRKFGARKFSFNGSTKYSGKAKQ